MSPTDPKSWFDHLSPPQRIIAIAASLIGLIGGMALLLIEPPAGPAFFLILAFALFGAAVLHSIPRTRAWVGNGHQLYPGLFLVFKSLSGELETPFFRITALVVGILLLLHLVVRGVIMEWRRQDSHHTVSQPH